MRLTIRIITDGGADFPEKIAREHGFHIVPLHVTFGDEAFDIRQGMTSFYSKMKTNSVLPKTASPSPQDFVEAYERYPEDDILVIGLSSGLSSTYQHALLAKEMAEEGGSTRRIEVIDTRNASIGQGLIAYRASQEIAAGKPFSEVAAAAQAYAEGTRTLIYLDTLENVVKGGRLDRAKGAIASVLNIKLFMHASPEGTVEVVEKVRGKKNALAKLVAKVDELGSSAADKVLGIAHSTTEEEVRGLLARILEKNPFREVVVTEVGPVIGTYAGQGGIVVSYT
ncbi:MULTISPECIES: DegV family protein [Paenibacillus]|uniref:DegV family protein n=1 Tax=Paenibacillus TaxID=44249 RepID=UPI0022B8C612|nr:DegV family protein [Paenibacillus caseinilyticus]MCZ8521743.1 DegV family protein [Paenibacillus caseinilyticus]